MVGFGARSLVHDLAPLQDHGPVGVAEGRRALLDEDDGHALGVDLVDHLEDRLGDGRGQPERGFVDEQQPGAGHQRPADGQHLLLPARRACRPAATPAGRAAGTAAGPGRGPRRRSRRRGGASRPRAGGCGRRTGRGRPAGPPARA